MHIAAAQTEQYNTEPSVTSPYDGQQYKRQDHRGN